MLGIGRAQDWAPLGGGGECGGGGDVRGGFSFCLEGRDPGKQQAQLLALLAVISKVCIPWKPLNAAECSAKEVLLLSWVSVQGLGGWRADPPLHRAWLLAWLWAAGRLWWLQPVTPRAGLPAHCGSRDPVPLPRGSRGSWALEHGLRSCGIQGSLLRTPVGSSQTGDRTHIPLIGRWTTSNGTTRHIPLISALISPFLYHHVEVSFLLSAYGWVRFVYPVFQSLSFIWCPETICT